MEMFKNYYFVVKTGRAPAEHSVFGDKTSQEEKVTYLS
jgi:hypothetical protein